jgi:predicted secreted protein
MGWVSGIVVYIFLWWLTLFVVLPWGVRQPDEPQPGLDVGAPEKPRMKLKVAVTTVIAVILWLAVYWLMGSGLINFRDSLPS